ncbi:hypothetical protein BVX97_05970 [bacterium E08(2017)]|nr:hypothetical protein BVX97_05970 [bacterium E08(2017)]
MRILIIHNYYQQFGGTCAFVNQEKELLENNGHDVRMFTRHSNEIKSFGLAEKVAFIPNTIYSSSSATQLNDVIDDFEPEVAYVHAVQPLISYACYDVLHKRGIPCVQMLHDYRFLCPDAFSFRNAQICEKCMHGNFLNAVTYKCYKNSHIFSAIYAAAISNARRKLKVFDTITRFICTSEFCKAKFIEAGISASKISVRPHYIEGNNASPSYAPGEYGLFIGRLSPEKGLFTLLEAMKHAPEIDLKVMGTGPLEDEMKSYIKHHAINNVEMLGFKTGQEKYDIIRDSAFTIIPSIWNEVFGLIALESFSCGKPVIASDIGSLPYVVQDNKTGILVEPGNAASLTKAIVSLYEDKSRIEEMGHNAYNAFKNEFSPENSYRILMEVFKEVTA